MKPSSSPSLPSQIGRYIPLPLPVPDWSKPIILALVLLSLGFGARARFASARARRLERRQRALTADLGAMQTALVPELPPQLCALELSAAYRPAEGPAAGGDFYDAFALDGARVAVILGDVSGHGRAALAHAARMRYTLRAYVEAGLPPREALKLAGSVIGNSGDGMFTTVAVAIHDLREATLTYATAGHPPPIMLGEAAHELLGECASPPLGWGIRCGCRQTTVPFPRGSRACFFSDGLIEARTENGLLGREGLATIFEALGSSPSARDLLDQVRGRALEVRDDMAACIVEAASGLGTATRVEEYELDLDQLVRGNGQRFLHACRIAKHEIPEALTRASAIASDHELVLLTASVPGGAWTVAPSAPSLIVREGPSPKVVPLRRPSLKPITGSPHRPTSPTPA